MDAMQFEWHAKEEQQLRIFLQAVSEDAARQIALEEPQRFLTVAGADLLFAVAAYAAFRWAKDYLDHRRALNEVEILKQQAEVTAVLIQDGFPPKDAQALATALLKGIASRTVDDPALKKTLALIAKTK